MFTPTDVDIYHCIYGPLAMGVFRAGGGGGGGDAITPRPHEFEEERGKKREGGGKLVKRNENWQKYYLLYLTPHALLLLMPYRVGIAPIPTGFLNTHLSNFFRRFFILQNFAKLKSHN